MRALEYAVVRRRCQCYARQESVADAQRHVRTVHHIVGGLLEERQLGERERLVRFLVCCDVGRRLHGPKWYAAGVHAVLAPAGSRQQACTAPWCAAQQHLFWF